MFQENIYIVKNNQHHPSLSPSRRSQRQRLRRQDPAASSSETAAGSVTTIDPVTLPISNSVGVSTPPTDNTESSSTTDSSSPSSSCSITDTSSASSSDSSSSLPSSSETSSSESSTSPSPPPSTTPSTPPHTDERSDPPMSQETSNSSGPTVTDTPSSSPSSSSSSTSTMSSSSVTPPPPPPPPTSSSSSGTQESTSTTDTSTTSTSTSDTSSSTSTSTSISTSRSGGQRSDVISTTPTTTSTSDSSISTSPGGGSSSTSTSTSPSSADRPGDSTTGSQNPPTTANGSGNPVTSVPMQNNGSPTATPRMTLSEPVTFTTTDASGSTHLTVPPEFTTVIVTTLPGGTFTTFTEVMANPSPILHPPDDVNRDAVAAFFQNKGAVAGVFIAASLAICAIVLFVIFAIRRRRNRFRTERDAEIAAGLAAAISNSRFADDEDYPVVFRNGQRRSPLLDDDDAYNTVTGPVMYNSNSNGVGPPTQHMPIISEVPYPSTAAHYTHARTNSGSPSPNRDSMGLPVTSFEQVSPTGNSGRSSYGGAAYFGRDSSSPTTSAPGSVNHGTVANPPSVGHAPSLYGGHRPPASAGRDGSGNGTGSGSGGTSQPSLMTATPAQRGASSSRLEDMYRPQYEQYSRPNSGSAVMGIAYEPDPVPHEHQIVTDLRAVRDPRDEMGSPLSADIAVSVASVYSRDEWDEEIAMSREDSRLDPVMRRTGGLASTASVGPRDEEDYSRRVMHQQLMSPSTGSNSHSMSHSHSTH